MAIVAQLCWMMEMLFVPILPYMVAASLEDLAVRLPKLSALGLPMLHLHRLGVLVSTITPGTTIGTNIADVQFVIQPCGVDVGGCLPSMERITNVLEILSKARVPQVSLPNIGRK